MTLKEKYYKNLREELAKELSLKNSFATPIVTKIVLNSGIGEALKDPKILDLMAEDMTMIAGQKAVIAKSREDISNFNRLKKGDKIGVYVTLRGEKMWSFLDKLISVVLPGVKDFRGISKKSFDGSGNYSLGMRQHSVFPEVDQNRLDKSRGMQITIQTSSKSNEAAYVLLKKLGMPFRD
jgi:large subunit ribosomal protein L5